MIIESNEALTLRGSGNFSGGTINFKDKQIQRAWLEQVDLSPIAIPLNTGKTWDAANTALPTTAASDDLGFISGTHGTAGNVIQTSDAGATTVTQKVRFSVPIDNLFYVGETLTLRVYAGMDTTVSDGTATLDVTAYTVDGDGTIGSDICATAAQSINSLTNAYKDFVLTSTSIAHGDEIDVVLTVAITDAATATDVIGEITGIRLLRDTRG